MRAEDARNFLDVPIAMAAGPQHKIKHTLAIGARPLGLKLRNIGSGQAETTGPLVALHRTTHFHNFAHFEQTLVARGHKTLTPQHDFRTAGEILKHQHPKRLAGLGHLGLKRTNHSRKRKTITRIRQIKILDQP